MPKQTINTGTSANSRTGDSLRTAFTKINQNFTELYANTASGGASVTESVTPPSGPTTGDLWYDTAGGRMYVYFDSTWVDTNPSIDSISKSSLKSIAAASTSFTDFQTRIAAL
jgi:hypothetical protein